MHHRWSLYAPKKRAGEDCTKFLVAPKGEVLEKPRGMKTNAEKGTPLEASGGRRGDLLTSVGRNRVPLSKKGTFNCFVCFIHNGLELETTAGCTFQGEGKKAAYAAPGKSSRG